MTWLDRQPDHRTAPIWNIAEIKGAWPEGCSGILLRNGPALFQRQGETKQHLFDGDGLIQKWELSPKRIQHRAAWIHTQKFEREQREDKFLYPGLASNPELGRPIRNPDNLNTANTNLIAWNGSLLALWEAGSAHEIEPERLETLGPKVWSTDTKGAPFGAYPKVDDRGNLWNIGIAGNKLLIYVIEPNGGLKHVSVHTVRDCAIAHDFVLTERFLGVWLAPIRLKHDHLIQSDITLLQAMEWHEREGSQFLLFDRHQLELVKTIELDAELIFHFANAWEEGDSIHMTYVSSSYEQLQNGMLSNGNTTHAIPHPSRACLKRIDLTGGISETVKCPESVELPQIDERLRGTTSQTVFCLSQDNTNGRHRFNGIIRYEL